MTLTKRKQKKVKRKTRKRNLPKDHVKLSNSVKNIIHDKLYKEYRSRVIDNPSFKNLQALETIVKHSIKTDLTRSKSYSPSINRKLVSLRSITEHPLFTCSDLSALENTASSKELMVKIMHNKKPLCTSIYSPIAKKAFLRALRSKKINYSSLIVPIQFHSNCWFNTIFMCMFISDKGRKFTRFLRQAMIEGKLINGNEITPKSLKKSLILFNAAIEAVQNKGDKLDNASLALNTNSIIHSIYRAIPKHLLEQNIGIKDVREYGNPIFFYNDLINFIDASSAGAPSMKILSRHNDVSDFLSGNQNETSDIVVVQLYNSEYTPSYAHAKHFKKRTNIHHKNSRYNLDSAVIRDNNHTHFCCSITCNKKEMLYDGAAFTKLVPKKWKALLNKNKNWSLPGSKTKWNFTTGYQILFYYRV
jgi:hypothetical protein